MKSETIGKLAEALAKAQGQLKAAKKESTNPFFKAKYADLESVWDACREALSNNGLAITQAEDFHASGSHVLVTTVMHSSGEWIDSTSKVIPKDPSPQAIGSALTYARRYALAAMVGVYQSDDDAEAAQARPQQAPAQQISRTNHLPIPQGAHRSSNTQASNPISRQEEIKGRQ